MRGIRTVRLSRMQTGRILALGACGLLVAAVDCGLDSGGVLFSEGPDASTDGPRDSTDATADRAGGDGGSTDSGQAPRVDAGPCTDASLPLCDDDAAACATGNQCTPPLPVGWEIVSIDVPCADPYIPWITGSTTIAFASPGPTVCSCVCNQSTAPSCASTADVFSGPSCGDAAGPLTASSCTVGPIVTKAGDGIQIVRAQTPATCTPTPTVSTPTFDAGARQVCKLTGARGLCQGHSYCAPSTGSACIAKAGPQTCPTGFSNVSMSTGAADSRTCTACACAATTGPCTGLARLGTSTDTCTGGSNFDYDGGCIGVGASFIGTLKDNELDTNGTTTSHCVVSDAGAPTGSVTPTDPFTVCCR